ncbi:3',5'-cyclic-nucleotide phosphodiesterase [Candidatus Magnetomoraceae bacterium gMMP-1]
MKVSTPKFIWISLGVDGGLNEGNLSAHLLAPYNSSDFICLDAGSLLTGLRVTAQNGGFKDISLDNYPEYTIEHVVLHHHIKAYLISHCYLDHVNGLASISPNDSPKPIISLSDNIDDIRDSIFNWRCWPNMANEGKKPHIGQYQYVRLEEGKSISIPNTSMHVEAFPLSHDLSTDSAAFLIESNGFYALYMGDTGPDEVEERQTTETLWKRIAPLIQDHRLKVISMEASYKDERSDELLLGHLTPSWIMKAFHKLADMVNPNQKNKALEGLNVIITHIKPDEFFIKGKATREVIEDQLQSHNDLGIRFILPKQGERFEF